MNLVVCRLNQNVKQKYVTPHRRVKLAMHLQVVDRTGATGTVGVVV